MKFGSFLKKKYSSETRFLCEFLNCDIIFLVCKSDFLNFVPKKLIFLFDCCVVDYYKIENDLVKVVLL